MLFNGVLSQTLGTGLIGSSRDDGLGCNHLHGEKEAFSRAVKHQDEKMHH